jgi:hypothetical protein
MDVLEECHKLPRRIVLTRWLSSAEAVWVVLNSRRVCINFFSNDNNIWKTKVKIRIHEPIISSQNKNNFFSARIRN